MTVLDLWWESLYQWHVVFLVNIGPEWLNLHWNNCDNGMTSICCVCCDDHHKQPLWRFKLKLLYPRFGCTWTLQGIGKQGKTSTKTHNSFGKWLIFTAEISHPKVFSPISHYADSIFIVIIFIAFPEVITCMALFMARCSYWLCKLKDKLNPLWPA